MSLHAQISHEAKAALAEQKRTSTLSALIISVLSFGLVILILMVIAISMGTEKSAEITYVPAGISDDPEIDQPKTTSEVERRPATPPSSMAKMLVSASVSPTAIPVPVVDVTEVSVDVGLGDDFGTGDSFGEGDGPGGPSYRRIPTIMKERCTKADRLARLEKEGGSEACEEAVVKSLQYFQGTQNADGSWGKSHRVGYTGLALLAYLGHCETPVSPEFGATVEKAMVYLINVGMANSGKIASDLNDKHWPYEHGIATYALAEAYTLCQEKTHNIPNLKDVVEMAGLHIISTQHQSSGGWDYNYDYSGPRGGDSSIVCWQMQALKACKYTGIESFSKINSVARKGLEYLENCQTDDGGVRYSPTGGKPTMTGGLVLCHQQWGRSSRGAVRKGRSFIENQIKFGYDTADADLYAHYYYGQAMINFGGSSWSNYNKLFRDEVLNAQNADGSYKVPGGGSAINGTATTFVSNAHYRTCLATLMLEVYYRFLPGSSDQ